MLKQAAALYAVRSGNLGEDLMLPNNSETPSVGRYRWVVAFLLFLANAINYVDRSALSIVAPIVSKDLGFNPAQLGLVFSAFFVGYSIFCFIGGWASDRWGPRLVFAVAMTWWSLFCGFTALATGFASLLLLRVLFGFGEGPMGSVTNKTITNWFPRQEAGTVVGLTGAGNAIGGALSGPIVGLLAVSFGWRPAFWVIMTLGLVWLAFWMLLATDRPSENRRVSAAERAYIDESRKAREIPASAQGPAGSWLRSPVVLAIALAFFSYNYVLYFFLTWLPSYLTDVYHLELKQMSLLTVIPWVCGAVGMFGGGLLSDLLFRLTGNSPLSRKVVLVGGLALAALCVVLASQAASITTAVTLIACANLFLLMAPQNCWVLVQEMVPLNRVGMVGGFVQFLANTAGIFGPALTGFIVQYGGGYGASFVLAGVLAVAGALAVLVVVPTRRASTLKLAQ
ncbi:MAG: MFS transporter [Acetobacteraceae bacterium]|nr:MFS transporter [Acetobacteraceae bacterium]